MYKKSRGLVFLSLIGLILFLLSLSTNQTDGIRGIMTSLIAPFWKGFISVKDSTQNLLTWGYSKKEEENQTKIQLLTTEYELLKTQVKQLKKLLGKNREALVSFDYQALPAKVIFRSPSTWDEALWINVGAENNKDSVKEKIVKNSPVVIGKRLVGLIDYVGKRQARVRLITDSQLNPAVRVMRQQGQIVQRLAKGELRGALKIVGKGEYRLKGVGFNYDYPDEEGPARDLRTGQIKDSLNKSAKIPLIRVDDLLVTSGLDGVFPADLEVATVTKIYPLKEGDYYYQIEAKPCIENLHDLSLVFVIQPIDFDCHDTP